MFDSVLLRYGCVFLTISCNAFVSCSLCMGTGEEKKKITRTDAMTTAWLEHATSWVRLDQLYQVVLYLLL